MQPTEPAGVGGAGAGGGGAATPSHGVSEQTEPGHEYGNPLCSPMGLWQDLRSQAICQKRPVKHTDRLRVTCQQSPTVGGCHGETPQSWHFVRSVMFRCSSATFISNSTVGPPVSPHQACVRNVSQDEPQHMQKREQKLRSCEQN